jgi:hypothetical protein
MVFQNTRSKQMEMLMSGSMLQWTCFTDVPVVMYTTNRAATLKSWSRLQWFCLIQVSQVTVNRWQMVEGSLDLSHWHDWVVSLVTSCTKKTWSGIQWPCLTELKCPCSKLLFTFHFLHFQMSKGQCGTSISAKYFFNGIFYCKKKDFSI